VALNCIWITCIHPCASVYLCVRVCVCTLHLTAFNLHPAPYILHPTPYTQLHSTLYTLYPIPYTLHPTPYALYPTPYTLHPEPYTQGDEGRREAKGGKRAVQERRIRRQRLHTETCKPDALHSTRCSAFNQMLCIMTRCTALWPWTRCTVLWGVLPGLFRCNTSFLSSCNSTSSLCSCISSRLHFDPRLH